jgi:hypothetical protein
VPKPGAPVVGPIAPQLAVLPPVPVELEEPVPPELEPPVPPELEPPVPPELEPPVPPELVPPVPLGISAVDPQAPSISAPARATIRVRVSETTGI